MSVRLEPIRYVTVRLKASDDPKPNQSPLARSPGSRLRHANRCGNCGFRAILISSGTNFPRATHFVDARCNHATYDHEINRAAFNVSYCLCRCFDDVGCDRVRPAATASSYTLTSMNLPASSSAIGMDFDLIPPDTFAMRERIAAQKVTLTKPFQMGDHKVIQASPIDLPAANPTPTTGSSATPLPMQCKPDGDGTIVVGGRTEEVAQGHPGTGKALGT